MRRISVLVILGLLLLAASQFGRMPDLLDAQNAFADGPQIHLQAGSFDPLQGEPEVAAALQADAIPDDGDDIYLLQFVGPVQEDWKQAVEQSGAELYGYVPDYAFIARLSPDSVVEVRTLPFVRWIGDYRPAYRLAPELATLSLATPNATTTPLELTVLTLPDADLEALADRIERWGGRVEQSGANEFTGGLRIVLDDAHLAQLARQPNVVWIERYLEPQLQNDVGGGQIMRADEVRTSLGLFGDAQIVAVADSGLDVGTTGSAMSDDFEGRIVAGQAICAYFQNGRTSWSDLNGHGTHVSGSVLGNGSYSGSNPSAHDYSGSYAGVAPEARLVFQSVDHDGDASLECVPPASYMEAILFGPAYDLGVRIHSNSWGGPTGGTSASPEYGGYTSAAQAADYSAWLHQDLFILFAAGNSGIDANADGVVDADSINSPGTAKNVVTVGATESLRPLKTTTYDAFNTSGNVRFPSDPIRSDRLGDDEDGMAAFSSRGSTDDGRFKPDVVAPGTWIISARSHEPGAGTAWGSVGDHYMYSGGTSMSTPLVAGAATLIREWLVENRQVCEPSSALVKSVLLNGAVDISPGQYGTGSTQEVPSQRPNAVAGWGRVDLVQSIDPPDPLRIWFEDERDGLQTGETATYSVMVGTQQTETLTSEPLRITLAWTDYPGQPGAGKMLVNDLDLEVQAPDGTRYYGNGAANVPGPCLGGNADRCNNAEGVTIQSAISGTYTVTVRAYNVPEGPQPFALVGSGDSLHEAGTLASPPAGLVEKSYLPIVGRGCS